VALPPGAIGSAVTGKEISMKDARCKGRLSSVLRRYCDPLGLRPARQLANENDMLLRVMACLATECQAGTTVKRGGKVCNEAGSDS
jgi:hypothetical protein